MAKPPNRSAESVSPYLLRHRRSLEEVMERRGSVGCGFTRAGKIAATVDTVRHSGAAAENEPTYD